MSSNPNGPTPLAIRGCRDHAKAKQDIEDWVQKTSGRENDDPERNGNDVRDLLKQWESLGGGDAVLFVERNDAMELQVNVCRVKNPDEPTPLVIRGCRDHVKATQDIIQWVKETSGRENDDPKITEELSRATGKLKSIEGDRDAVLLLERNDAKELEVTVLTTATRSPLAIRGCRDRVQATQDILKWVEKTSARENDDPIRTEEVRYLVETWKSLRGGDAVLFVKRNDAMELHVTVLPAQQ